MWLFEERKAKEGNVAFVVLYISKLCRFISNDMFFYSSLIKCKSLLTFQFSWIIHALTFARILYKKWDQNWIELTLFPSFSVTLHLIKHTSIFTANIHIKIYIILWDIVEIREKLQDLYHFITLTGADPAFVIRRGPNSEHFQSNLRKLLKRGKFFLTTQSLVVKRNWVYINQFIKTCFL